MTELHKVARQIASLDSQELTGFLKNLKNELHEKALQQRNSRDSDAQAIEMVSRDIAVAVRHAAMIDS